MGQIAVSETVGERDALWTVQIEPDVMVAEWVCESRIFFVGDSVEHWNWIDDSISCHLYYIWGTVPNVWWAVVEWSVSVVAFVSAVVEWFGWVAVASVSAVVEWSVSVVAFVSAVVEWSVSVVAFVSAVVEWFGWVAVASVSAVVEWFEWDERRFVSDWDGVRWDRQSGVVGL